MNKAGVMLIVNQGLILSISRRDNKEIFGLPGGKCEPGETQMEASIRETQEETSVIVHDCVPIYSRVEPAHNPQGIDFESATFFATSWEGTPQDSEEGEVAWLTAEELTTTKGAFPKYNRDMINKFKEMFPNVFIEGESCSGGCNNTGYQTGDNEGFICEVCDRACSCPETNCLVHQR